MPSSKLRRLWLRIRLAPFESAIAVVIIVQAVTGLAGVGRLDPIGAVLPGWATVGFQLAYLAAGLLLLFGVLRPRGDIEGAGLVLLGCVVLARGLMFGVLLGWGWQATTALAFSLAIAVACVARLHLLAGGTPR